MLGIPKELSQEGYIWHQAKEMAMLVLSIPIKIFNYPYLITFVLKNSSNLKHYTRVFTTRPILVSLLITLTCFTTWQGKYEAEKQGPKSIRQTVKKRRKLTHDYNCIYANINIDTLTNTHTHTLTVGADRQSDRKRGHHKVPLTNPLSGKQTGD